MRQIDLQEYKSSGPLRLSADEIKGLRSVLDSWKLAIEPDEDEDGHYRLRSSSTIGAFRVGDMSVSIRPKLPISRVLFLASYALGNIRLREERVELDAAADVVQAMARLLFVMARRAFARGLHRDYRVHEEALTTVKGRIRVAEQIRYRFGIPVPVEVRYDEFTEDITANRLVKAAAEVLIRMRLRDRNDRTKLAQVLARLENVSWMEYDPRRVPAVRFNRLNEHYREVLGLARVVLQNQSVEVQRGDTPAPGFLMDMNMVFQNFVVRALREELGLTDRALRSDRGLGRRVFLDEEGCIGLQPDLSLWEMGKCTFVGDAKYKSGIPTADLYQMLAYTTALNLPGGLLIYAQGEPRQYKVRHCGKLLEVFTFDLSGTREELLAQVRELAERVRALRRMARDQGLIDQPTRAA